MKHIIVLIAILGCIAIGQAQAPPDNDSIITVEQTLGRIGPMLKDPRTASDVLNACLVEIGKYSRPYDSYLNKNWNQHMDLARSYRLKFDKYAQSISRDKAVAAIKRIQDSETRSLIRLLYSTIQLQCGNGWGVYIMDTQLHNLIIQNTLLTCAHKSISLANDSDIVVLERLDPKVLDCFLPLLVSTGKDYGTWAWGHCRNVLEAVRLYELANRSPRIRSLINNGTIPVPDSLVVYFGWNKKHYPQENWEPHIVRLPQLKK